MQIFLKDELTSLKINNEGYEGFNFVELTINGREKIDCELEELYAAINAFMIKKRENEKTQKAYH